MRSRNYFVVTLALACHSTDSLGVELERSAKTATTKMAPALRPDVPSQNRFILSSPQTTLRQQPHETHFFTYGRMSRNWRKTADNIDWANQNWQLLSKNPPAFGIVSSKLNCHLTITILKAAKRNGKTGQDLVTEVYDEALRQAGYNPATYSTRQNELRGILDKTDEDTLFYINAGIKRVSDRVIGTVIDFDRTRTVVFQATGSDFFDVTDAFALFRNEFKAFTIAMPATVGAEIKSRVDELRKLARNRKAGEIVAEMAPPLFLEWLKNQPDRQNVRKEIQSFEKNLMDALNNIDWNSGRLNQEKEVAFFQVAKQRKLHLEKRAGKWRLPR